MFFLAMVVFGLGIYLFSQSVRKFRKASETTTWVSTTGKLIGEDVCKYERYQTTPTPCGILTLKNGRRHATYEYSVADKLHHVTVGFENYSRKKRGQKKGVKTSFEN